ncbi:MAG: DUF115 domain-containing protein [Treponema sp.]|nr:DUF115 domain-containing protein [Treponema sp.]
MDSQNIKPCLVNTPQGFSVSYKERLLYSKYAPEKSILRTIEGLNILPGTFILAASPLLFYGLNELLQKLPENSFIAACEFEEELYNFSSEVYNNQREPFPTDNLKKDSRFSFLTKAEIENLPYTICENGTAFLDGKKLPPPGTFKRLLRIDFSAGTQFHNALYQDLEQTLRNSITTFWTNRLTLTKFGRKYSQNLFMNLKILPETCPIQAFLKSVEKEIILFGAGESSEEGIKLVKESYKSFYIICADTALIPLLKNNIIPDAVFLEEAQNVISKAFIHPLRHNKKIHYFAGITSIPQLSKMIEPDQISYFTSLYTKAAFLDDLEEKKLLPLINKPFGSVGLTALWYASQFRKDDSIPIYIYGLDFSYTSGKTHTRGAIAHTQRLCTMNRLNPAENYTAAYINAYKVSGKNGKEVFTTKVLQNYSLIMNYLFQKEKNIFDSAKTGLESCFPGKSPNFCNKKVNNEERASNCQKTEKNINKTFGNRQTFSPELQEKINSYFEKEGSELKLLRDILTAKVKLSPQEAAEQIKKIAAPREYLYLHFPDGQQFSMELSFLKRVRTSIDFFLKQF